MKKLFILFTLLIGFAAFNVAAQDFTIYKAGVTELIPTDVIVNTGTDNQSALLKIPKKDIWGLACLVKVTAGTGSVDIDLLFESSMDGTNYQTITSTTLSGSTLSYLFEDIDGWTGRYFRVTYTGGGGSTQSTTVNGDLHVFRVPH